MYVYHTLYYVYVDTICHPDQKSKKIDSAKQPTVPRDALQRLFEAVD